MSNKTTTDYLYCPACGSEIMSIRERIDDYLENEEIKCDKCGAVFTFDLESRITRIFTTHYGGK